MFLACLGTASIQLEQSEEELEGRGDRPDGVRPRGRGEDSDSHPE